ncbi:MAG: pilin, partial [Burkholderiaceae bacterium]|nr:pilin [Burkholderiaceae bacterium]
VIAGSSVKAGASEAFQTDSVAGLTAFATAFNSAAAATKTSKFVSGMSMTAASPWTITVSIAATSGNGIPTALNNNTLRFSPNVRGGTPTAASQGAIDWACGSATVATATARGLSNRAAGTLPAKYAPSECR